MKTYSIEFTIDELRLLQSMFDATVAKLVIKREFDAANEVAGVGLKILLPLIKDMNKDI